jgi:hypothetical protein
MRLIGRKIGLIGLAAAFVMGIAFTADAQRPNSREVRDLLRTLNARIDDFDYNLRFRLRSSSAPRDVAADAASGLEGLKEAVRRFEENLAQRRENRSDVNDIITAAQDINGFLRSHPQNRAIESGWSDIRDTIGRLAGNYGVTPDWSGRISNATRDTYNDDPVYSGAPQRAGGLTGTYQIDRSRSEAAADILSGKNVRGSQRQDLETKLDAPDELALSVRGSQVTLASSNAAPVTFAADGRDKTEQANGRTIRVRATLRGDQLTISSLGGETDYTVTFESIDRGNSLKVTRRITTEYLSETIFAESIYEKTDAVARLGINDGYADNSGYSSNDPQDRVGARSPNPSLSQPRIGEFIVPNGTTITGLLDNEINTKVSQNNDRFRITVQNPIEYRGAVIEGYLTGVGRSGQVSGRSNVTFNFERITLRDGRAYDFAGFVSGVRDHMGKEVRVDNEGTAQGDSQTRETAKRGGIGAGLGALIGAIAGGAKGAVIGAVIGGGAGAGSVIVGGRDDVRLMPGSTVTIEAASPVRQDDPRDN